MTSHTDRPAEATTILARLSQSSKRHSSTIPVSDSDRRFDGTRRSGSGERGSDSARRSGTRRAARKRRSKRVFLTLAGCAVAIAAAVTLAVLWHGSPAAGSAGAAPSAGSAAAASQQQVALSGEFRDFTTGGSVPGAQITITRQDGTVAAEAVADASGAFATSVGAAAGESLTASYKAVGYLTEQSVIAAEDSQVALDPLLTPEGTDVAVLYTLNQPDLLGSLPTAAPVALALSAATTAAATATSAPALPATIRVYRTQLATPVVQVVDFKFYVKHVLPCEWLKTWPMDSLKAGAVAVKEYAWNYVSKGGKWPSLGADVKDNWADQYYDPNRSSTATDTAVDATWDTYLTKSGNIFATQFCGDKTMDSEYRCTIHPARMAQWGTMHLAADKGMVWQDILIHYYPTATLVSGATGGSGGSGGSSGGSSSGVTRYEQTDSRLSFTGDWSPFSVSGASGGSYARSNTTGASVTIPFRGTRLDWIATKGTTMGKARVSVDGKAAVTVNLSSSSTLRRQRVWSTGTLASGLHWVSITWDTANSSSKSINLDAVDIAGSLAAATRIEDTSSRLAWNGSWTPVSTSQASAGRYKRATASASCTFTFTGARFSLIGVKGPHQGTAKVTIDGGTFVYIDTFASAASYEQKVWTSGFLNPGSHKVTISWTGLKNSTADDDRVTVDAVEVIGS